MSRATDQAPTLALSDTDFELQRGGSRRARAALHTRLVAWARSATSRLGRMGIEVSASVDDDASHVAFEGQECARLALAIEPTRVEVGVELTDARAARARLAIPERALELTTAIETLPEQFTLGLVSDDARAPLTPVSTDELRAWLDRLGGGRLLWLGWSVPREVAVTHAALLDEQLEDALVALAQLYRLVTRAPGEHTAKRPRKGEPRTDHEARKRGDDDAGRGKRRSPDRRRERDRDGEGTPEPDVALAESEREVPPARLLRPAFAKAPPRPGLRRPLPSRLTERAPVEKGARVRVLEGPFAGKIGVVHELDGKGGARVMLGLLAVRLDVKDLAPCVEGRARPLLSTSHRKPMPVRS
jgi:hypothetical protein